MKIIVCVKQVPDTSVPVDIEQDGKNIVEDGLVYMVNPEDLCALEAAVKLKETAGGEVTAVTLGPPRAEERCGPAWPWERTGRSSCGTRPSPAGTPSPPPLSWPRPSARWNTTSF